MNSYREVNQPSRPEGLRERKRRETRERIASAGFTLFVERGFDGTTIDMIADKAGISRRTFFYYYSAKEDIIFVNKGEYEWMNTFAAQLPLEETPIAAAESILVNCIQRYASPEVEVIDRIMRSTPTLMARRYMHYERWENALFGALVGRWYVLKKREALHMAAMSAIGILRLASDLWHAEAYEQSLDRYVHHCFGSLRLSFL